jgi:hypothetical protein
MGFYFQTKKVWIFWKLMIEKKEYVKKIKLKKNMRTRTIDSSHHVEWTSSGFRMKIGNLWGVLLCICLAIN